MSKELEKDYLEVCFKRIKNLQVCVDYEKDIVKNVDEILPNSCNKVEQALLELKAIKEAEPSEALKCANELWQDINGENDFRNDFKHLKSIKQALLKAQENETDIIHYKGTIDNLKRDNALLKEIKKEQEKVLKIVFEKRVDLCILTDCDNVNEYNKSLGNFRPIEDRLTYEEFELLKRYFEKIFKIGS